jgi:hypothetical protein
MELDFVHPENNQGMLVLKGSEILVGQEVVDAITIIRPLEDVEDFRQGRIKARLLADRTGIRISLPAAPAFLIEAKDINALYELDGRNACAATKRAHDIVATDIQADDERRVRHIVAYFPEGITCSNRLFNDGMHGNDLKTYLQVYKNTVLSKGKRIASPKPLVHWKLVLETGRTRRTAPASGKESYDKDLDDAIGKMEDLGK